MKRTPNLIHDGCATRDEMWARWERFAERQLTAAVLRVCAAQTSPLSGEREKADKRLRTLVLFGT